MDDARRLFFNNDQLNILYRNGKSYSYESKYIYVCISIFIMSGLGIYMEQSHFIHIKLYIIENFIHVKPHGNHLNRQIFDICQKQYRP